MPAPTSPKLALDILGDEKTPVYPIYRYGIPPDELATISTAVMNLDDATVTIYGGNPTRFDPVVVMPLWRPPSPASGSSVAPGSGSSSTAPAPSGSGSHQDNDNSFGTPFIVAASIAGVLLLVVIVLLGVLATKNRKSSDAPSVNSVYARVE